VKFTGGTQTSTSIGFVIATSTEHCRNPHDRVQYRLPRQEALPEAGSGSRDDSVNGASAIMSRGEVAPVSAANAGVLQLIERLRKNRG
jgi:hypothetical protein